MTFYFRIPWKFFFFDMGYDCHAVRGWFSHIQPKTMCQLHPSLELQNVSIKAKRENSEHFTEMIKPSLSEELLQ